jgi:hypothetical protein
MTATAVAQEEPDEPVPQQAPSQDEPMPQAPPQATPAQPPPQAPVQAIVPPSEEANRLERSGKAMVGGGAFLIAVGAAAELTGLVMSIYSQFGSFDPVCAKCDDPRTPFLITGLVTSLAAGGLIYGGTAVLSAGKGRIRRAKLIRLNMSFGSQQVSAQAALNF